MLIKLSEQILFLDGSRSLYLSLCHFAYVSVLRLLKYTLLISFKQIYVGVKALNTYLHTCFISLEENNIYAIVLMLSH